MKKSGEEEPDSLHYEIKEAMNVMRKEKVLGTEDKLWQVLNSKGIIMMWFLCNFVRSHIKQPTKWCK